MLGTQATLAREIKGFKLQRGQAWIIAVALLALVGVGGWWSYQNGLWSQWLPVAQPVTAASGEIVIEQMQAAALPAEQAENAAAVAAQTASTATAAATPAAVMAEPVVIAGVAGVNGTAVWDDAGHLIGTLGSGALLDIKASAAERAWLLVETADGTGWVRAAEVIAYGLGRLPAALLPGAVVAAGTAAPTLVTGDAAVTAVSVDAGSAPAAAESAASAPAVALAAVVATGDGSNLNVRSGPGTDYAAVAKAADGSQYQAVGRSAGGDWLLLQLSEDAADVGWAAAAYLELGGDLQTLPVVGVSAGA
jgi:uncharacterized protein YraI